MLVYDVTKDRTFTNVSKWLRNIEEVSFCRSALCLPVCTLYTCTYILLMNMRSDVQVFSYDLILHVYTFVHVHTTCTCTHVVFMIYHTVR